MLREELYMARETIIGLMGPEIIDILMSYSSCPLEKESRRWRYVTAGKIVKVARPRRVQDLSDDLGSEFTG